MPAPHALPILTWRDLRPSRSVPASRLEPKPAIEAESEPTPELSTKARDKAATPKEK